MVVRESLVLMFTDHKNLDTGTRILRLMLEIEYANSEAGYLGIPVHSKVDLGA